MHGGFIQSIGEKRSDRLSKDELGIKTIWLVYKSKDCRRK
jgi:hypothetical protein